MSGVIVTLTLNAALHLDYAAGEVDAEGIRPFSRPSYRAGWATYERLLDAVSVESRA